MPVTVGFIPLRNKVKELGKIYGKFGRDITEELLRFDIGDFQELKAMRTEGVIDRLIKKLNRAVIRWARSAVPEAYRKAAGVSLTRLEIMGVEKDDKIPPVLHRNTIDHDIDKTIDVLLKSNMSIKPNVSIYLYLARRAFMGLMQLQEFSIEDGEILEEVLRDAAAEGGSLGELERLIRIHLKRDLYERKFIKINGKNYDMIKYAKMVARTTLREVQSDAVRNMAKQFDNDLVEISSHATEDDICLSFDGNTYSIGGKTPGYDTLPMWPPFHPNCLLPGQRVKTPGGFISGMKAKYNGKAVKITLAKGGDLSVTVNHLFLTPQGFAPANLLREGDDIFYCTEFEGVIPGDPDENRKPAFIDDIICSLSESDRMTARSVPVSSIDFHGDGQFFDGDVNIIGANGFLKDAFKSPLFQKPRKNNLNSSDMALVSLFPKGTLAEVLLSAAHTADSIMGGFRSPSPFFLARASGGDSVGFTNAPFGDSGSLEDGINDLIGKLKFLGDVTFKRSGLISIDKVLKIDVFDYHGFVYDLHTKTSLYLISGALSSNCMHFATLTSLAALETRGTA